ncbi:hypothetical protein BDQ17DRAFT_1329351 [Cyathus striatus]|nr:hypothetical protein BDQ17DRAFT_1329351 [Cyathus striatus]
MMSCRESSQLVTSCQCTEAERSQAATSLKDNATPSAWSFNGMENEWARSTYKMSNILPFETLAKDSTTSPGLAPALLMHEQLQTLQANVMQTGHTKEWGVSLSIQGGWGGYLVYSEIIGLDRVWYDILNALLMHVWCSMCMSSISFFLAFEAG